MNKTGKRWAKLFSKEHSIHKDYSSCVFFHFSKYKWIFSEYFPLTRKVMTIIEYNFNHQYKVEMSADNGIVFNPVHLVINYGINIFY